MFLNRSISADSDYYYAYYWLGLLEYNVYRNEIKAERYFLKAANEVKPEANAYIYLGSIYLSRMDNAKAEIFFNKAISQKPVDDFCRISLIEIFLKTKREKEALALAKILLNGDSSSVQKLINLGIVFSDNNKYSEAEKLFKKVIQLEPQNALAYNLLGIVYNRSERSAASDKAFKKAVSIDTNYVISYYSQYKAACLAYNKADTPDSSFASSFFKLAWLFVITNRFGEAEMSYMQSLKLNPDNATTYTNLGWMYILVGRKKEAEVNLIHAISLDTSQLNPLAFLGMLYFNEKKINKADSLFNRALKFKSDFMPALFGKAYVLSEQNKLTEAWDYLSIALLAKSNIRQLRKGEEFMSCKGICLLHCLQGLTREMLEEDDALAALRKNGEWTGMMGKRFKKIN